MSQHTVISVRGLGKRYELGETFSSKTLRDALANGARHLFGRSPANGKRADPEFWALRDVSFDVTEGEVVGIIGHNGAGKSTLLKIVSGITDPTEGEVRMRGRVGALLEVGTGFHQELSGRENIFMNGSILGMTQVEIQKKFDEIVAFAGIEPFIDTPVKRYSSGMLVRLGFAVAAHLEPEILIIDEVLAVGDLEFQRRCLGKMEDVAKSGRTILFVSHNLVAVEAMCSRVILVRKGRQVAEGSVADVMASYQDTSEFPSYDVDLSTHAARRAGHFPSLKRLVILDAAKQVANALPAGRDATFRVEIEPPFDLLGASFALHFYSSFGQRVMSLNTAYQWNSSWDVKGPSVLECRCTPLLLAPGRYSLTLGLAGGGRQIDRLENVAWLDVVPSDFYGTGKTPPQRDGVLWPHVKWSESNACVETSRG